MRRHFRQGIDTIKIIVIIEFHTIEKKMHTLTRDTRSLGLICVSVILSSGANKAVNLYKRRFSTKKKKTYIKDKDTFHKRKNSSSTF